MCDQAAALESNGRRSAGLWPRVREVLMGRFRQLLHGIDLFSTRFYENMNRWTEITERSNRHESNFILLESEVDALPQSLKLGNVWLEGCQSLKLWPDKWEISGRLTIAFCDCLEILSNEDGEVWPVISEGLMLYSCSALQSFKCSTAGEVRIKGCDALKNIEFLQPRTGELKKVVVKNCPSLRNISFRVHPKEIHMENCSTPLQDVCLLLLTLMNCVHVEIGFEGPSPLVKEALKVSFCKLLEEFRCRCGGSVEVEQCNVLRRLQVEESVEDLQLHAVVVRNCPELQELVIQSRNPVHYFVEGAPAIGDQRGFDFWK